MPRVLDLADVLQLIHHRFDQRSLPQQQLVPQQDQSVFHVLFDASDQLKAAAKQLLEQILADVSFVAHEFAEQFLGELWHGFLIADIAGCEADVEQLTLVVDDQMQLETEEPADRCFAASGQTGHHPVAGDSHIVTDFQRGGIDETDAAAGAKTRLQESDQRRQGAGNLLDKTAVTEQTRELGRAYAGKLARYRNA